MKLSLKCPQCANVFETWPNYVNRATKIGARLYCGRACAGLARRRKVPLTDEQAKAVKRAYDAEYRAKNRAKLKTQKRAWFESTYDREKAAIERKANMARHVAYCRRPEYKAWKQEYDKRRKFDAYGPFAEAAMLLDDLETEISTRATRYEIYIANGRFTRSAQQRRRELWQLINRH